MHTLQYVAIHVDELPEGENGKEYALAMARDMLETDDSPARWSDWCQVGGGRWQDVTCVLNGATDEADFKAALTDAKRGRANNLKDLADKVDMKNLMQLTKGYIAKLEGKPFQPWNAIEDLGMNMDIYRINRITTVLTGDWTSDSGFYDLSTYDSEFKFVEQRLDAEPEKQYLVPVDFHF
jgi:hypothetical protein